jgi:hypothetical protein
LAFPNGKASWKEIEQYCAKTFDGNPSTIYNTLKSLTTNAPVRLGDKRAIKSLIEDLFFQGSNSLYRKYGPTRDPAPLYFDGKNGRRKEKKAA